MCACLVLTDLNLESFVGGEVLDTRPTVSLQEGS